MLNAQSAVKNSAGQIVCAINADAITTNDDAACAPLNPFGQGNESAAARAYVSALTGSKYHNTQDDFLLVLGGDLIKLPAGAAKFSAAYEHRKENTEFRPFDADLRGITTTGSPAVNRDAGYNTNEYSGELLVPIVGGDFTLPAVKALEFNGSYRYVDHSIAGIQKVWGYGGRWDTGFGLSLRASKSRNFRAPSLDQLFAPTSTASGQPLGSDPCDADRINGGSYPAARLAACQKEFAAHPEWGPLTGFQDPAENTGIVSVTSGGNPDLKNEISNTTTWGVVFQPDYIKGLTVTVDRVEVALTDGLVSFSPASFAVNCYDLGDASACATFSRNALGYLTQARSTTFNAGLITWNGDIWNVNYRFPLGAAWDKDLGTLELGAKSPTPHAMTSRPTASRTRVRTARPRFRTSAPASTCAGARARCDSSIRPTTCRRNEEQLHRHHRDDAGTDHRVEHGPQHLGSVQLQEIHPARRGEQLHRPGSVVPDPDLWRHHGSPVLRGPARPLLEIASNRLSDAGPHAARRFFSFWPLEAGLHAHEPAPADDVAIAAHRKLGCSSVRLVTPPRRSGRRSRTTPIPSAGVGGHQGIGRRLDGVVVGAARAGR
jgi:hypothetical protein